MHLHIENSTAIGDVFEITPTRLAEALVRHLQIAQRVKITLGYDGDEFENNMSTADALFAWSFTRSNLGGLAPQLKWIQLQGAGINHLLPLDWLPADVTLTNSRGVHGQRAVEYIMMALLALNNGLPKMMVNQQQGLWQGVNNSSISGKTLLIFGVGHIGGDVARAAKYFGMRVVGIRRSGEPCEGVDEMYQPRELHNLLPLADFVLVTAPHTSETERVFDQNAFGLLKQGAGFIGYSRSRLIDYQALQQALKANKISAVVDVFDEEPLPRSSSLWGTPNLIITPHSSSNDPVHHAARSLDLLFENVQRFLDGQTLHNIVSPGHQY
ncbi:MAG: phosphoglycerate dehydrogenase-like enzyme [Saprospiraceae bacterium]